MNLETRLTSVVVYPDRARVTRQGRAELGTGAHRLEIADLTLRMIPESARVSARGTARARLSGLQVQPAFYEETPAAQVRELEAQVEAAHDELSGLQAQMEAIARQRAQLDALAGSAKVYAKALASGQMSVEAQLAMFDRLRSRTGELDAEAIELEKRRREVDRRLKKLQGQLDASRSQRPRQRYTAVVEVEILQPGDLIVEVSYMVAGAGWTPLYDLRLTDEAEKPELEVGYLAQVIQHSGEDWNEVALTLSTTRPGLAAAIPELDPWYIQPLPPPRPLPPPSAQMKAMRMAAPAPEGAMSDMAAFEQFEVHDADEVLANVETSGAAVSYAIPGWVTIPPDGTAHKVVIARYPLPPVLDYVTAPSLVPEVYRRAKVKNESEYTLLPGPASLFAGDEYLGTTHLELTASGGEIELYLGSDDRVRVERELVRRETDKTLIGGRRRLRYGYEIRLENLLSRPVDVLVRDRFPISKHEEVKVRLETVEPRPTRQNELNQVDWQLNLAPGEKRTLRFDFLIEHPPAMELLGLPDAAPKLPF